jgi:hypothetical protein
MSVLVVDDGVQIRKQEKTEQRPTTSPFFYSSVQTLIGERSEVLLDIPPCLIQLEGGIQVVEEILANSVAAGEKWIILV